MEKVLIIDKDGTLTTPKSGKKFVQSPKDQKIIPGAGNALTYAKKQGYKIAVASNQGGVLAGYKTEDEAIAEFNYLHQLFPEIDYSGFCPDGGNTAIFIENEPQQLMNILVWSKLSDEDKEKYRLFRKPEPGMLQVIVNKMFPKIQEKAIYVGDRLEDEAAAMNANIMFVWANVFRNDYQRFL